MMTNDTLIFYCESKNWHKLCTELNKPPVVSQKIQKLLKTKAPWEESNDK